MSSQGHQVGFAVFIRLSPVLAPRLAAAGESQGSLGHLIVKVAAAERGTVLGFPPAGPKSSLDSSLASQVWW
jgi:hypothetical protein